MFRNLLTRHTKGAIIARSKRLLSDKKNDDEREEEDEVPPRSRGKFDQTKARRRMHHRSPITGCQQKTKS